MARKRKRPNIPKLPKVPLLESR